MRHLRPVFLAALLGAVVAVPAYAEGASAPPPAKSTYAECKRAPSADDQEKGHNAYTLGKEKYDGRDLDAAIFFFKEAYAKDCTNHEYLIIISRAYERQNNLSEAILALETYVLRAPNAADVEKHKSNIDSMKKERAKLAAAAAAASTPSTATTTAPTTAPPPPPPQAHEQEHSVAPWVVTGAGVVALGTGITLLVIGAGNFPVGCSSGTCDNRYDDGSLPAQSGMGGTPSAPVPCSSNPAVNGCSQSGYNRKRQLDAGSAQGLEYGGLATTIGGGVLVLGGLLWHFLEPTGPKKEGSASNLQLVPVVTPGYGGLAMGARF